MQTHLQTPGKHCIIIAGKHIKPGTSTLKTEYRICGTERRQDSDCAANQKERPNHSKKEEPK
jgi:hypothetical protein